MKNTTEYSECRLCMRNCGINREAGEIGYCKMTSTVKVARAALHFWEEPIISGTRGSGTIFFSGCSLGCIFCQNAEISHKNFGTDITAAQLVDAMLKLEKEGAHNINFVTPTHYLPTVREVIKEAKSNGLSIPVVYNTGSCDSVEALKTLDGLVDIYLPDMKFFLPQTSKKYANAPKYTDYAKLAIDEMVRQKQNVIVENGIMKFGVLARILLLPGHVAEAKLILKSLHENYADKIYVSLMCQYTPIPNMPYPINRKVTKAEYYELLTYAEKIGIKNGFTQDFESASEKYIPAFDNTGI